MFNLTQPLRQAVQAAADVLATRFLDRDRTWSEVTERIARLAAALIARGLKPDDRVAVLALNSDRYFELYYAVWWAGGAIVPLNTRWNDRETVYALDDSESSMLFIDDAFLEVVPALLEGCGHIRTVVHMGEGEAREDLLSYESMVASHEPAEDTMRAGDDLAGLFYTGGTTGFPKGVMLSHDGLYISGLGGMATAISDMPDYVFLHHAPMFHLADAMMIVTGSMLRCTHAMIPQFEPKASLEAVQRFRATNAIFVPTMLAMFVRHPDFDQYDLSSLKLIGYGASPMPTALLRETMERLPHTELFQGYGQTELSPLATMLAPEDHVLEGPGSERLKSAGRVMPHCETEVVDESLQPVPSGTIGQIRVRGPNVMLGYWKQPALTAETIVDGWLLTGDAGYIDEAGFLYVVDRVKDMIVSGGENVYSVEVENAIMEHEGIGQCAVIGIPHEFWVEQVHALVVPKPGSEITEQEIIDHCHEHIAGYKCPRSVEIRREPLPLSGAGKVLKRELRPDKTTG